MITAVVTGNLGRDAEVKDTRVGKVCSFSVASNKGRDSDTTWVRCSLFGKRGESLAQYLSKGTKVAVAGELSTHEYQGKTYLELRVSDIDLMGGGDRGSGQSREQTAHTSGDDYGFDGPDDEDQIPF